MAMPSNSSSEITSKINEIRWRLDNLAEKASLRSTIDQIASLDTQINNFSVRIHQLRERSYAFDTSLEKAASEIEARWPQLKGTAQNQLTIQVTRLQSQLQSYAVRASTMGVFSPLSMVTGLEQEISQYESQCDAAGSSVESSFSGIENEANLMNVRISQIEFSLEQMDQASFALISGESIVRAVKAVWCKTGKEQKDDPEGVLFLTDQRVVFEQKEEIATKKVLFVPTGKQKVQQLLFEFPVAGVSTVKGSKAGLLKNIDMLEFELASGNFANSALLHIFNQPCDEWQRLVMQVKTREIDSLRVIPVDTAAQEKVKNAPTNCPSCGAVIKQTIVRGQDKITCEFCGAVIRL